MCCVDYDGNQHYIIFNIMSNDYRLVIVIQLHRNSYVSDSLVRIANMIVSIVLPFLSMDYDQN